MNYFITRYEAFKAYPNSIIRKVLNGTYKGFYVTFEDCSTFEAWVNSNIVRGYK